MRCWTRRAELRRLVEERLKRALFEDEELGGGQGPDVDRPRFAGDQAVEIIAFADDGDANRFALRTGVRDFEFAAGDDEQFIARLSFQ